MSNSTPETCIGNSCLDHGRFDKLSQEALRLIRDRKALPVKGKGRRKKIKNEAAELKETTKKVVSTRLSTSQQ